MKTFVYCFALLIIGCLKERAVSQVSDNYLLINEVDSIINLSHKYIDQDEFNSALNLIDVTEKIIVENFKENEFIFCKYFNIRGLYYYNLGKHEEAKSFYWKELHLIEKIKGKNTSFYAKGLINIANVYIKMGQYELGVKYVLEAKLFFETEYGKTNKDYLRTLNTLGVVYKNMGLYELSKQVLLEQVSYYENNISENYLGFAVSLNSLGNLYSILGDYNMAYKSLSQSLELVEKHLGENSRYYGMIINNMAFFCNRVGDHELALKYLQESGNIIDKSMGKNNGEFAKNLSNLAAEYILLGDLSKSEALFLQAKFILEKIKEEGGLDYINLLVNLASNNVYSKKYKQAELLFFQAKKILDSNFENEILYKYNIDINLAFLYYSMDSLHLSDLYYRAAIERILPAVGSNHPDYISTLFSLAVSKYVIGDKEDSVNLFSTSDSLQRIFYIKASQYLSESELTKYSDKINENNQVLLSFIRFWNHVPSEIIQDVYDNQLLFKAALVKNTQEINMEFRTAPDSIKQRQLYRKANLRLLATEYLKPVFERDTTLIASLESDTRESEKKIIESIASYSELYRQVNWNEVQKSLNINEGTVEFIHAPFFNSKTLLTDSVFYTALILLPHDSTPHFIPLFEEKQLSALLGKTGNNAAASTQLYAASRSGKVKAKAPAYGTELYNLIWKPLDSLLQGVKTVYFSPSGLLHRVAFAALPVGDKQVLADRYALHQLGSTRSLVVATPQPVAVNYTAAVFGGIEYDRNEMGTHIDSTATEVTDNRLWSYIEHPRNSTDDGFEYLPGTATEVRNLNADLRTRGVQVATHTGAQATEEALKALGRDTVKSPDILHIATHGFFFPDPEKNKIQQFGDDNAFKWNENPLFRSGLALAGANQTWKGEPTPANLEDGIATAYEISHLNLSNTKLVVLSACETGLGDIKGSEGVYGLQRAFKMAGADYLLVSLWQVPDKETAEFMDVFYKTWLNGKTIHEAFAKAQKQMRKKYKEVYKWGAWVLVE